MGLLLGGKCGLEMGCRYLEKARSNIASMWNCQLLVSFDGEFQEGNCQYLSRYTNSCESGLGGYAKRVL